MFTTLEGYGNWSAVMRSAALDSGKRGVKLQKHGGRAAFAVSDSSPAVVGSVLFSADYAGWLFQIDTATGRPGAAIALGSKTSSSPAISDGLLYIGTSDGRLVCVR